MQVSVESVDEANPLARKMTVQIPKERFEDEVEKRFKSLTRTAKINGFRPGKVPLRVVKQKYGLQVRQEVLGEVLEESLQAAVQQENLHIAGQPSIELNSELNRLEIDGLSYTADFEVFPEPDIQLEGLKMEKIVSEVTDADVEKMLEKLRKQRREWTPVEEPIGEGHKVTLDFSATIDGQPFKDSEMQDVVLLLEDKPLFSKEFEDNLQGAKVGDDLEFPVTFQADHSNKILAGQQVLFKVHLKEVSVGQLPELDNEFVKSLGIESGDVDKLKGDIRDNMQRELKKTLKSRLKTQVMEVLVKANPIQVPNTSLQAEKERVAQQIHDEMVAYRGDQEVPPIDPEKYADFALHRVRQGLLMGQLIRANNFTASPERIESEIVNMASAYEDPTSFVSWFYSDEERVREVEATVLEAELVDWLLNKIEVTEKMVPFETAMDERATIDDDDEAQSPEA